MGAWFERSQMLSGLVRARVTRRVRAPWRMRPSFFADFTMSWQVVSRMGG